MCLITPVISVLRVGDKLTFEYCMILDTNAYGILKCAIAMIFDDNFTRCRQFKVNEEVVNITTIVYCLTHNAISSTAKYRVVLLLNTNFLRWDRVDGKNVAGVRPP